MILIKTGLLSIPVLVLNHLDEHPKIICLFDIPDLWVMFGMYTAVCFMIIDAQYVLTAIKLTFSSFARSA